MKPKVAYILPIYEEGTDTHFFYNYLLIREAAKTADIFVIVEKCPKLSFGQKIDLGEAQIYVQKYKFPPLRFLEMLWMCFKLLSSGFRGFYVHYSYYGVLAVLLTTWRLSRQVKVFYWNRGMPWLFKQNWLKEKLFRFILRNSILVTGPESLAKEYVARYGVKEYRVVSNWIDTERFKPDANKKLSPKIVLFVHHLSKRKGVDFVPKIAEAFKNDDVEFVVIGAGPEFENCKLEIENSGLTGKVKLLGPVANAEVVRYFKDARVFLMPSREEGSPRVILEAMASGVPFVASNIGGIRELVPKSLENYLCEVGDIECFQGRIKSLLSDEIAYNKARIEALEFSKGFGKEKGVREFINLFESTDD
ncbi:glycosyltransferase family 4 protein [Candidatus Giovannonibacteria bacterium]|nr:glycosyltransferase family 4 protein [Candidatus Giovannonibacteria bacterium]